MQELFGQDLKIGAQSFTRNPNYANLSKYSEKAFWVNNAATILEYQLFKTNPGRTKEVPFGWLFYSGYDNSPESVEQKEIIYSVALPALKRGYRIGGKGNLTARLTQSLNLTEETSLEEKTRRLKLVEYSFGSIKAKGENPSALLGKLKQGATSSAQLYEKRLYLLALAGAVGEFKTAETQVCKLMGNFDVYTRQMVRNRVQEFKGKNPFVTPEGKINRKVSSDEKGPLFCGEPLYANPIFPVLAKVAVAAPPPPVEEQPKAPAEKAPKGESTQQPKAQ